MTWILSPGDWDGDGNNDVVARRNDGTLRLYPGTGTGTFVGSSTQIGNGWNSMSALVAPRDWDGDGNNDLLGRQTDGDLFLYRGNGSGGFIGSATQIGNGWHLMVDIVGPGDWDGDGNNDLIARRNDGNLWLFPGNGSGGFNTAIQIGNGWSNMTWILAPGDWNGDGHPDLIARHSDGKMWLYKGNGTGGFINPPVQIGQGWGSMTWLIAG
jgi:hypothetical protein